MRTQYDREDMHLLAEIERDMDAGRQPYVVYGGSRMAVEPDQLQEFGLVSGQTINHTIARALMEWRVAKIQAAIALKEARNDPRRH